MLVQIGNRTVNLAAMVAVKWFDGEAHLYLQGVTDSFQFDKEEAEQLRAHVKTMLDLAQFVQQTQSQLQQQGEQMMAELNEKKVALEQQLAYCNQVKAELDRQANLMAINKGKGFIGGGKRQ